MLDQPWVRVLCAVVLAVPSVGCAVSRYRYISLEGQPGVEIETRGTSSLKRLYFSSSWVCPEYSIERKDYQLLFRTNLDSYLPEMRIAVTGNDGEQLRMSQQASRRARSNRAVPCGSFGAVDDATTNELRFSWVTCADAGVDET